MTKHFEGVELRNTWASPNMSFQLASLIDPDLRLPGHLRVLDLDVPDPADHPAVPAVHQDPRAGRGWRTSSGVDVPGCIPRGCDRHRADRVDAAVRVVVVDLLVVGHCAIRRPRCATNPQGPGGRILLHRPPLHQRAGGRVHHLSVNLALVFTCSRSRSTVCTTWPWTRSPCSPSPATSWVPPHGGHVQCGSARAAGLPAGRDAGAVPAGAVPGSGCVHQRLRGGHGDRDGHVTVGFGLLYAPLMSSALLLMPASKSGMAVGFYNLVINVASPDRRGVHGHADVRKPTWFSGLSVGTTPEGGYFSTILLAARGRPPCWAWWPTGVLFGLIAPATPRRRQQPTGVASPRRRSRGPPCPSLGDPAPEGLLQLRASSCLRVLVLVWTPPRSPPWGGLSRGR
ncbi:hypothetical protein QJS66_20815 [Kocuria rhizophila]|nr:hypothetical protein QJS66_20815 [Kocuria rhizophila]